MHRDAIDEVSFSRAAHRERKCECSLLAVAAAGCGLCFITKGAKRSSAFAYYVYWLHRSAHAATARGVRARCRDALLQVHAVIIVVITWRRASERAAYYVQQ